jgi:endogenous inhibitor of DNA gyrase (YacG/DUF329 family)
MKTKVTEENKELMRNLYVNGMLACEEIGDRLGMSRQTVNQALRKMGVDTAKRKLIVDCTECRKPVEKTRAEVRKHLEHFCSLQCYALWMKRPAVHEEHLAMMKAREQFYVEDPWLWPGIFLAEDGDIIVFKNRDDLLEWQRTGLTMTAFSVNKHKNISVNYKDYCGGNR